MTKHAKAWMLGYVWYLSTNEHGASIISVITENEPEALYKTLSHTTKVYNTQPVSLIIEVLLIKILLFSTTEVFTCSKEINAFKQYNYSLTDLF